MNGKPGIIEGQAPPQGTYEGDIRGRGGVDQGAEQRSGQGAIGSEESKLDVFLSSSGRIIKDSRDKLKQAYEKGGLAQAASMIFNYVDARYNGFPDIVRVFGGIGVITQIIETLKKDGVEVGEDEIKEAVGSIMADQLKKGFESGQYSPQEMLQAAEQVKAQVGQQGIVQGADQGAVR